MHCNGSRDNGGHSLARKKIYVRKHRSPLNLFVAAANAIGIHVVPQPLSLGKKILGGRVTVVRGGRFYKLVSGSSLRFALLEVHPPSAIDANAWTCTAHAEGRLRLFTDEFNSPQCAVGKEPPDDSAVQAMLREFNGVIDL